MPFFPSSTPEKGGKEDEFKKAMTTKSQPKVSSQTNPFDKLSHDLLLVVFSFLEAKNLSEIARVSKLWNHLSSQDLVWKRHSEARGLFFPNDIKKNVINDIEGRRLESNIFYLCIRTSEKDPTKKKITLQKGYTAVLNSTFKSCWDTISDWTLYNTSSDEKNVVYKLYIPVEQQEAMNLQRAERLSENKAPAYYVAGTNSSSFDVEVVEITYQPSTGGTIQRVSLENPKSNKVHEDKKEEQKGKCVIS